MYVCMRITRRKILKVFYRFIYAVRGSTVGRLPAAISFSRVVWKVFITARITNSYTTSRVPDLDSGFSYLLLVKNTTETQRRLSSAGDILYPSTSVPRNSGVLRALFECSVIFLTLTNIFFSPVERKREREAVFILKISI